MNPGNCALASGLVSATYVQQGQQALGARLNLIKSLLSQRKMPMDGWDDATIEMLLQVGIYAQQLSFPNNSAAACACVLLFSALLQIMLFACRMQLPWTATTSLTTLELESERPE